MVQHALPTAQEIQDAASVVYRSMAPTPQTRWPLLIERAGCEVWVKHENHTPIGSFKLRGGLLYLHELAASHGGVRGVIAATRGNYGQSVAYAARLANMRAVVVVPEGNSEHKNAAMRRFGAELIEHGDDFEDAKTHAEEIADAEGLHLMPSYGPTLVRGVATYGMELFQAVPDLDVVYVPIGLGSGICGVMAARDWLSPSTRVVGVVTEALPAYRDSFAAGTARATAAAATIADGMAVRVPDANALELILRGVERVVAVSESELRAAMRIYYTDAHQVAEGAAASPLAALLRDKERMGGRSAGLALSGGTVDSKLYAEVLTKLP